MRHQMIYSSFKPIFKCNKRLKMWPLRRPATPISDKQFSVCFYFNVSSFLIFYSLFCMIFSIDWIGKKPVDYHFREIDVMCQMEINPWMCHECTMNMLWTCSKVHMDVIKIFGFLFVWKRFAGDYSIGRFFLSLFISHFVAAVSLWDEFLFCFGFEHPHVFWETMLWSCSEANWELVVLLGDRNFSLSRRYSMSITH